MYLNRKRDEHGRLRKIMARKKICPTCGRLLWRRDFYVRKETGIYADCKECFKAKRRDKYVFKRKDGFYLDEIGRPIEYHHGQKRLAWTPQMVDDFKRFYPTTKNEELAGIFMVSPSSISRKAKSLGIKKDKVWLNKMNKQNAYLGGLANKKRAYLSQASSS